MEEEDAGTAEEHTQACSTMQRLWMAGCLTALAAEASPTGSFANCDSRPVRLSAQRSPVHPSSPVPSLSSSLVASAASVSSSSSTFPRVFSLSPVPSKSTAFLCDE